MNNKRVPLFATLDKLVQLAEEQRAVLEKHSTHFSPLEYAKELCTVSIGLPRQIGLTTYIAIRASWEKGVAIVFSEGDAQLLTSTCPGDYLVYTPDTLLLAFQQNKIPKVKRVYIDHAVRFDSLEEIYRVFLDQMPTFVVIGR